MQEKQDGEAAKSQDISLSRRALIGGMAGAATLGAVGRTSGAALARTAPADAICAMEALPLSRAIHARTFSCVEVMTAFLDRIDRINPRLNAIVALQPREALLAQAREKDAALAAGRSDGWLHGVPFAVKDLAPVKGLPFTSGSPLFRNQIAEADSPMVARLRAAGSIFIGKTNTPEFGMGSHTYNMVYGLTRNPYDPARSAGGSSGGAAVSISTRMLAVADGSDLGGSLRNPAAWNNVYGLRPSYGRIAGSGEGFLMDMPVSGPMARSITDLGMLLSTMSAPVPYAPLALDETPADFVEPAPMDLKGVRIGWLGDFGGLPMEAGVLDLCREALRVFEDQGAIVEPVQVPASIEKAWQDWVDLRAALYAPRLLPFYRDPAKKALLKPEAIWEIERGLSLSAMDVMRAQAGRQAWYRAVAPLFDRHAFLVAPSAQIFPFDAQEHWPRSVAGQTMDSYHRWMEVCALVTLSGCPALAAPAGFGASGLPNGIQIIAPLRGEKDLLRVGQAYHLATRWPEKRPPRIA